MKTYFPFVILISFLFSSFSTFGNNASRLIITDKTANINLGKHTDFFLTQDTSFSPFETPTTKWEKSEDGLNFGISKGIYWLKYTVENETENPLSLWVYAPYHQQRSLKYYHKKEDSITFLSHQGTTQSYSEKQVQTAGYAQKYTFPKGKSVVYIRINQQHIPMRAFMYLVNQSTLNEVVSQTNSLNSIWTIVMLVTLFFTLTMHFFTKLKVFIYYGMLNIGVLIFVGTDIGFYFHFFDQNTSQTLVDINQIGNILITIAFPLFLNELTPLSGISPKLWKIMKITVCVTPVIILIDVLFPIRETWFFYFSIWYVMFNCAFIFVALLYLLIIAVARKQKNSLLLLILYSFYVSSAFYEVLLPNMGIYQNSIFVYDTLLKISILEVVLFFILIGKEMNSIFQDRNLLLVKQKEHQQNMLTAVVKSQEIERNAVGEELQEIIEAKMEIVKEKIPQSDLGLNNLIEETITSVQRLRNGLRTPKMEGEHLMKRLKKLCELSSNDYFTATYEFQNWQPLTSQENANQVYRIVQELLQNTLKHSQASKAHLQIIRNKNQVTLTFMDNGIGFDTDEKKKTGKGLLGIQHRTEVLEAELSLVSNKKGTSVEIKFLDNE